MSDRFTERMADERVRHDTRLLGAFSEIYCAGNHPRRERTQLTSDGQALGVYSRKVPIVCDECAELLRYAEKRRAFCPQDKPGHPKPFCSHCETHCYQPEMRELMRDTMRYAGPRSVLHGYAVDGVRHVLDGRKAKAAAKAREAARASAREEQTPTPGGTR